MAVEAVADVVEIELAGITHGGEAVGRLPDGKACFVPFAIPGERVLVRVVEQRKRWARAELVEVLAASPDRVAPPCPYFGDCGGCQLQHVAPDRQAELRRRVVVEQLERIGGLADPPVAQPVRCGDTGYRHRARFGVTPDGKLGFRRHASHDIVPIDRCLLLTDAAQGVRDRAGDAWPGVEEVAVRTGDQPRVRSAANAAAPGGSVMAVTPGAQALADVPPGDDTVVLVDALGNAVPLRGNGSITIEVGGFTFRVSPTSFFQANVAGAAALLDLVRAAAAIRPGDRVLDLYAGVGLFARGLADDGAAVVAVEGHPAAAADARHNLRAADAGATTMSPAEPAQADAGDLVGDVEVVEADVGQFVDGWSDPVDVVVLDPPRRGAGRELVTAVAGLRPRTIVVVACDAAALARDAAALTTAGYHLHLVTPVDQFAQTAHVEAVATFTRE